MSEPLTETELRELREKAEHANQGKWILQQGICDDGSPQDELAVSIWSEEREPESEDEEWMAKPILEMKCDDMEDDDLYAEYIAAANPATVLRLLDMIAIRDKAIELFKTVVNVDRLDEILAKAERLLRGEGK